MGSSVQAYVRYTVMPVATTRGLVKIKDEYNVYFHEYRLLTEINYTSLEIRAGISK